MTRSHLAPLALLAVLTSATFGCNRAARPSDEQPAPTTGGGTTSPAPGTTTPTSGVRCGRATCAAGQVCCNASCGTCTEPGGMCTQQFCEEPPADAASAPTGTPGSGASACSTDADCRTFSDYCTGCDCRALARSQPDPSCAGPGVRCFADPCMNRRAACDPATHACVLRP